MWGLERKTHYKTLTNALAVVNQCYVIAANSANDDMASSSGIITPWGNEKRDDTKEVITSEFSLKEIKKVRKNIKIGLK
jgi:predicted amidohydrolase